MMAFTHQENSHMVCKTWSFKVDSKQDKQQVERQTHSSLPWKCQAIFTAVSWKACEFY